MTTPPIPGSGSGPGRPTDDDGAPAPRIVVVGADGHPVERRPTDPQQAQAQPAGRDDAETSSSVDQPTKVMRIGTMVKQLLDEVRSAPLDEAARARLAEIHARSVRELEDGLSPDLVDELRRITLPLEVDGPPSDAELRIAHAQLVGWLEGLFHGIQATLAAQRMASQAQIAQARHALPPGAVVGQPPARPGAAGEGPDVRPTPGQYL